MMMIDFRAPRVLLGACALLFAAACSDTPAVVSTSGPADLVGTVKAAAVPLSGAANQYDPLLAALDGRRFVLLGEATHGTHEFYAERAAISQRLIGEQQFAAVIVEGEWEDAWRVNHYVRGRGSDASGAVALSGFNQFPLWMWRNQEVAGFVEWLRAYNAGRPAEQRVGFYGMDVYGLMESLQEVPRLLDPIDPVAAERARDRYACFARYSSPDSYGNAMSVGNDTCEADAKAQFNELHARWATAPADERLFNAMQNARVVMGAEAYLRRSYRGGGGWATRDRHMAATVADLSTHLQARGMSGKVIAWAHNSHVGDGRAAAMGAEMSVTLGRLMRESVGAQAALVGFTTFSGSVIAAEDWGMAGEERTVRPGLGGSWESVFHQVGLPRFLLLLGESPVAAELGEQQLLERAIGVSYHPETERQSHYFSSGLADRFDAVIHIDQTSALVPLAR
jgi:erythromycin esterase-like protein